MSLVAAVTLRGDLSAASSLSNRVLLAKGTNPDDGGSEMLIRERDQDGAVFSVGSITWVGRLSISARGSY